MEDNKKIFTEVIKRQMAILGPDITLAKVKNVSGIEVDSTGEVTNITGDPQMLLQELINQFVELSGLIVKKTMESILAAHPDGVSIVGKIASGQPVAPVPSVAPAPSPIQEVAQPAQNPQVQVPTQAPSEADNNILSAKADLEDLNKMLNNIPKA